MLRAEEVREISGINNVLFTSLLKSKISELIISKSPTALLITFMLIKIINFALRRNARSIY